MPRLNSLNVEVPIQIQNEETGTNLQIMVIRVGRTALAMHTRQKVLSEERELYISLRLTMQIMYVTLA